MINRRTVLVLGAGASKPYGFQVGGELVDQILRELGNNTDLAKSVESAGFDPEEVREFRRKLRHSSRASIDAFLEGQPAFLDLGKFVIAAALLPSEKNQLFPLTDQKDDWYGYFFNKILTSTPDKFQQNLLSIISFNFDRSFERRLYLSVEGSFQVNDERETAVLARSFPIVHVHGVLAELAWLPKDLRDDPDAFALEYGQQANASQLRRECATQIQNVHENSETKNTLLAKDLLSKAEIVAFIGFGFNETNLRKIGCPEVIHGKIVYGTCHGLKSCEVVEVSSFFGGSHGDKIRLCDHTAYAFCRETKFLFQSTGNLR